MSIIETTDSYILHTYKRFPVALVSGRGAELVDDSGKSYIDLGSGIAVNTFGAADPEWISAITEQAGKLAHSSNLYYTEPGAELAKLLCEKTGMSKVFFGNSGAEANECAIKAARRYALHTKGEGHHNIISLKGSFHGRTLATLTATGQDGFHTEFGPFPEGFVYADPHTPGDLTRLAMQDNCCAVMLEVVQGEGGVNPLSDEFIKEVNEVAEKYSLLVIADEVQTGNGRTGKLYGYMNFDLHPDIVTTAKGLGGGLPIGAVLFNERCSEALSYGTHGSTFGANPICCAGALSVLKRIDDKLLSEVCRKSEYIVNELTGAKGVVSVSGLGLMLGIETTRPAGEIIAGCLERGVLLLSAKNKVRLLPPLSITMEQLETAVKILKEELSK